MTIIGQYIRHGYDMNIKSYKTNPYFVLLCDTSTQV